MIGDSITKLITRLRLNLLKAITQPLIHCSENYQR